MEPRGIRCATRGGPIMSRPELVLAARRPVRLRMYCPACFDKTRDRFRRRPYTRASRLSSISRTSAIGFSWALHGRASSPTPLLPASSSTSPWSASLGVATWRRALRAGPPAHQAAARAIRVEARTTHGFPSVGVASQSLDSSHAPERVESWRAASRTDVEQEGESRAISSRCDRRAESRVR
jgi:hypothetical protein